MDFKEIIDKLIVFIKGFLEGLSNKSDADIMALLKRVLSETVNSTEEE